MPEKKPRESVVALRVRERRSVTQIGEPSANVLLETSDRLAPDGIVTTTEATREERDRRIFALSSVDRFAQHTIRLGKLTCGIQGDT